MRDGTAVRRRRLYAEASDLVARRYREELTLGELARTLASSRRQIQRAYAEFGEGSFREELRARRLRAAAELLTEQPSIAVAQVGRIVGYRGAQHFSRLFRAGYGLTPGKFRERARASGGVRGPAPRADQPAAAPSAPGVGVGPSPGERRGAG